MPKCLLTEEDVITLSRKQAMFPLDWAAAENAKRLKEEGPDYVWLADEDWAKLMFQTRGQVSGILRPLRAYGQGVFVDGAEEEIMKLIDLVTQRVRGKDIPVVVVDKPKPMSTEEEE